MFNDGQHVLVLEGKEGIAMVPSRVQAHQQNRPVALEHPWVPWLVALALASGVGGVVLALPRAGIRPSAKGLVQISWQSLLGTTGSAAFRSAGRHETVPLVNRGGTFLPRAALAPGIKGTAYVRLDGPSLLAWLPWDHRTLRLAVTTPQAPRLTQSHALRLLNGTVKAKFTHPITEIAYTVAGRTHIKALAHPQTVVTLALDPVKPGAHGVFEVAVRSRTWQRLGPAEALSWSTLPFLAAKASTAAPIRPSAPLTLHFTSPIANAHLSAWRVVPPTPGQWSKETSTTDRFTPSTPYGFGPGALVAAEIPAGPIGPVAMNGSYLAKATKIEWTTPPPSVLRLQQLLAEEGYLPVSWQAATASSQISTASAQDRAIYHPPSGHFHWKYANLPAALHALWTPGKMSVMTKGAIMQFERVNHLPVDGIAGPQVFAALIRDRLKGSTSPDGYSYLSVTESQPETLELWVNGKLTLKTLANTGIPATPTYLGTYAIFERLRFQIMRGKNPNGVPYADPVSWINYFAGSDAVHGFYRASYGFPQSLGCVELPLAVASTVFHAVHYGTLVTVNPVGVPPAPAVVHPRGSTPSPKVSKSPKGA